MDAMIEELKRKESAALATNGTVNEGPEWREFTHALGLAFPAILRKLEAAELDSRRLWYLTEDHDDPQVREHRNGILDRMSVMSYSAACADIDAALAAYDKEQK